MGRLMVCTGGEGTVDRMILAMMVMMAMMVFWGGCLCAGCR